MNENVAETEHAEPETVRCSYCGATSAADAWYCLECGERVRPPAEPSETPEGSRRATILAILALCLIGGGAAAYGLTHREDSRAQRPATETAGPGDAGTTTTGTTTGSTEDTSSTTVPTETGATTAETVPATADDWSGTGFTVILKSLAKADHRQSEARTFADSLDCGAGVLDSSHFPALTTGYWVVYCGTYASRSAAVAAASARRAAGNSDAYARKVA